MRLSAISGTFLLLCSRTLSFSAVPLVLVVSRQHTRIRSYHASAASNNSSERVEKKIDNKAMAFLKKIGKVGGEANKDFRYAIGIDEGVGKTQGSNKLKKHKDAYVSCIRSGVIDDLSEDFPTTSSGTHWGGFTDRVMGGISDGNLSREIFEGKRANVLRGRVSLANNGGFIQMATDLAIQSEQGGSTVDATEYDGIELEVRCQAHGDYDSETFNVHLKTSACVRPNWSYRASFRAPVDKWEIIRIPWSAFTGHGSGLVDVPFDTSVLRRIGIVAIGRVMRVTLALSGLRFYKNKV